MSILVGNQFVVTEKLCFRFFHAGTCQNRGINVSLLYDSHLNRIHGFDTTATTLQRQLLYDLALDLFAQCLANVLLSLVTSSFLWG